MAQTRFEVLHLDDQPELVAWIPRAISTWFWKIFTDDMARIDGEDEEGETEKEFSLKLQAGEERLDTRYRIFTTPDVLLAEVCSTDPNAIVLVLLDQVIGEHLFGGSETYRKLLDLAPSLEGKAFILSAIPGPVLEDLNWPKGCPKLILKADAADKLVFLFVKGLISMPGVFSHTQNHLATALRMSEKRVRR